tara:strand:+ start:2597 stop:3901 length:1305 start_codon:yes stop_codon:yes gene_type:complete
MLPTRRITTGGGDVFRDEFSLAFDGTDDFIQLSGSHLAVANNFTIVAWVKRGETGSGHCIYSANDDTSDGARLFFENNDDLILRLNGGSVSSDTSIISEFKAGVWYHVAGVYDDDNNVGAVYANGVDVTASATASQTRDIGVTTTPRIGNRADTNSILFNGNISEVAIYDKALSASEVKTLYNGREPYNHKEGVCSSNLQGWWRMGDGLLDGNRTFSHTQTNDDSTQDNIISDESNSGLGAELYTFANALSTSAHESTNITSDGATDYTNGFRVFTGTTVELESSITNGSSHALKYTTDGSSEGFRIDLSEHVDDSGNGLDVGSVYQISVDARHIGTGESQATQSIRLSETSSLSTTGVTSVIANIGKSSLNYQTYKLYFIYDDTTTRYFGARETNSNNDSGGLYIDNLSIKKVNGNAGIMNNFSFEAIEGDTP